MLRKLKTVPGTASRFKERAERRALAKQTRTPWHFIAPKIYQIADCDQVLLEWPDGHITLAHRMP